MTWLAAVRFIVKHWKALLLAVLFVTYSGAVWRWGHKTGKREVQAVLDQRILVDAIKGQIASEAARKHEQADAQANARIAEAYEKGKQDAEAAGKRVADNLIAGNLKLRKRWQGCEATDRVSDAATRAAESDAEAADRAESAGRIVRAAREADEQIKGLQDILRAERGR